VFCVGVLCGSDLFTGVFVFLCVCIILYTVFSYALFSYMHIESF
jgi:hypothetical protein